MSNRGDGRDRTGERNEGKRLYTEFTKEETSHKGRPFLSRPPSSTTRVETQRQR